jgi:hypothetical protein
MLIDFFLIASKEISLFATKFDFLILKFDAQCLYTLDISNYEVRQKAMPASDLKPLGLVTWE